MTKTSWIWATVLLSASIGAQAQTAARKTYIVQLADAPVAGYTGQVAGYAATKPAPGRRLDTRAATVQSYLGYLNGRQSAVLATVPAASVKYRYRVAFNGFAASLTDAEAAALARQSGVLAVSPDAMRTVATTRTPTFLGLTAPGGLYSRNVTGENVIIGVIDSGITPESPAFSDKVDGNGKPVQSHLPGSLAYQPITNFRTWTGTCQTGPGFPATACNNKLIGAYAFRAGWTDAQLRGDEFNSPRDGDGHGTHTASTAGGNANVSASLSNGQPAVGLSGMAPRARIASYKALWLNNSSTTANGFNVDLVAAIDQAVADGVDVINYSISGTRTNYLDPVEVAFLFAADAGVFVAASAGNDGPANAVAHMSPWITTVAASTMDRALVATVQMGNGSSYTGLSVQNTGVPSAPLVLAQNAGMKPADQLTTLELTALQRCFNLTDLLDPSLLGAEAGPNGALNPALTSGKIVVCDRGSNARVNKSDAVRAAGGVGMVQVNTSAAQSLNADVHSLPSVHLASSFRTAVRAYAANAGATASFTAGVADFSVVAPVMAGFSSRGPSLASPNILKPDVTAPGVDVLASFRPAGASDAAIAAGNYPAPAADFLSGTSMSSPHVAGLAALLRQANPTWSPAAIKSALMTTTTSVKLGSGAIDTDRFGYGAGHVNPNAASQPGLVYDSSIVDNLAFLCGAGLLNPSGSTCGAVGFLPAWNLNLASLTSEVVGAQQIRRTVTNVGTATTTYSGAVTVPGFNVSVSPSSLTLAPGARGSFTVQAVRTTAPIGSWAFGNLDWTDGSQTVRSPVTLKPLSLAVQNEVRDNRVRANKSLTLLTGYTGSMSATSTGLVPATRTPGTVTFSGDTQVDCSARITVPVGTQTLRVALFNVDSSGGAAGQDDLDLELYRTDGTLVGSSLSGTADELVVVNNPAAATYVACVTGFGSGRPGATSSSYVLSSWVIGNGLANSLRVSVPTAVQTAGTGTASLMWSVPAGQRYVGNVNYLDGAGGNVGRTTVLIDDQAPLVVDATNEARDQAKMAKKAMR